MKQVSDAEYLRTLAIVVSVRHKVSHDQAVCMIQEKLGREWGIRQISTALGISIWEAQAVLESAMKKIREGDRDDKTRNS